MKIAYMAHPVGATSPDGVKANLERARRWLRFLQKTYPERLFIAPWLQQIEVCGDDDFDPEQRKLGLARDCAFVPRCDEFWPVGGGGRLTAGMTAELAASGHSDEFMLATRGIEVFAKYLHCVEPPESSYVRVFRDGALVTESSSPLSPTALHREPVQTPEKGVGAAGTTDGGREGAVGATRFRSAWPSIGMVVPSPFSPDLLVKIIEIHGDNITIENVNSACGYVAGTVGRYFVQDWKKPRGT